MITQYRFLDYEMNQPGFYISFLGHLICFDYDILLGVICQL